MARWDTTFIPLLSQIGRSVDELIGSFNRAAVSANPTVDQDNLSDTADNAITGLSVSESLGVVRATWNPVSLTAITRYDLELATNSAFTLDLVATSTQDPHTEIGDQTPGEGYFVRVRVVDGSGNPGPFTPAVGVNLSQVQTADLATAAVTTNQVAPEAMLAYAESGFFAFTELVAVGGPPVIGPSSEDYDGHDVLFPDTATRTVIEIDYESDVSFFSDPSTGVATITTALLRYPLGLAIAQAEIVDEIVLDLSGNTNIGGGLGTRYASTVLHFRFLSDPIPPEGPGTYTYAIRITASGSGGLEELSLIGTQLFITSYTYKR